MKKIFIVPMLMLAGGLVLTVTFAQSNSGSKNSGANDTVPKKEKQVRDLDDALLELDKGEMELMAALKEIDAEKIEREIRAAMKGLDIDMAKMKMDLSKVMKEIDLQKMNVDIQKELANVQKELKEIDGQKLEREMELSFDKAEFDKLSTEMKKAMKEAQKEMAAVDVEKMQEEIKQSLAKVDMDKMKLELDKIKDIDLSKMKIELENIRPTIEKSMQEAKKDIEKARQEISDYKNLVNALDKDGYLNKNENYKVEYKNKELTVNGKRLPADIVKKYHEFLEDKEDFTIKKEDDHFNINK